MPEPGDINSTAQPNIVMASDVLQKPPQRANSARASRYSAVKADIQHFRVLLAL